MHVPAGDIDVPIRPTWRSFVLSMVTGSLYQLYWIVAVGRELAALRVPTRTHPGVTVAVVAASQVLVLGVAASGTADPFGWVLAAFALLVGAVAISELGAAIRQLQLAHGVQEAILDPRIAAAAFCVGCAVGAAGVLPSEGLGPIDRVLAAISTGILLPFWLLYMQHQLNRALARMDPVSDDYRLFGGHRDDAAATLMRERIELWHRRQARSTELELFPYVTVGLAVICTLVFAGQVLAFGIDLSLREMRSSGAVTMELVRAGDWWRLVTQHFVHFTVDHWAFNMFALGMTGWVVERTIGHRRTAAAMAGALIGATALTWFLGPGLYGPNAATVVSGGESGIGFGMIGALLAIDRHGLTQTGRFARWMCAIGLMGSLSPGVGILAHAGGFAGGFVVVAVLRRGADPVAEPVTPAASVPADVVAPVPMPKLASVSAPAPAPAPVSAPAAPPPVFAPPVVALPPIVAPPATPPADRRTG